MNKSFAETFVHHCSATLRAEKAGSLFSFRPSHPDKFKEGLRYLDNFLSKKGLRVLPLDRDRNLKLIYVYRPKMLDEILSNQECKYFLCREGYPVEMGSDANVEFLLKKLREEGDFPHEFGIFLGYPLEDVIGYIENKGKGYTICGPWKVYGKVSEAKKKFARFRICREHCMDCLRRGKSFLHMAL